MKWAPIILTGLLLVVQGDLWLGKGNLPYVMGLQKQLDARAEAGNMTMEAATAQLLGEKEPSLQFTTPEELGALAVFFCSPAGNNVRGVAWNMDGGWVAQ